MKLGNALGRVLKKVALNRKIWMKWTNLRPAKINPNEINNLNRSIASKKTIVIKTLPTKKRLGTDGFSAQFNQNFKRN